MKRLSLGVVVFLALAAPAAAQDSRQDGNALLEQLGEAGLDERLKGTRRLAVRLGDSRPVGSLVLQTDLVERQGVPIYRLRDRLSLDLPGLGAARMLVKADLKADLSALEVVLETEESRGQGFISNQRVTLRWEKGRWVRAVAKGSAAPEVTVLDDLPANVLMLTAPLGAGERLARLVPGDLGKRLSVRGYDVEIGENTSLRLSVDGEETIAFPKEQVKALRLTLRQGASTLSIFRQPEVAGNPLRIVRDAPPRRLVIVDMALADATPTPDASPTGVVLAFLRACAHGDRDGLRASLDLDALYAASGGKEGDAAFRGVFEKVLLDRLADEEWLESQGLGLVTEASGPDDFVAKTQGDRSKVAPRGAPNLVFVLGQVDGTYRIVALPKARRE